MIVTVKLWGNEIGAVSLNDSGEIASFQYTEAFSHSGIEVAPLMMPLSQRIYSFPALSRQSFHGLPGMLADSLPDKFGNALINTWLASQGRTPESFHAIERLCYTGSRGMGALEFEPVLGPRAKVSNPLQIETLVQLASEVLSKRQHFDTRLNDEHTDSLRDILRVGTSAGGARAKAVIAWNPISQEVRSGQIETGDGFEYWLIKFDGVSDNRDKELADPLGFGAVEYAYSLMAKAARITMSECRILEENGRRHFMTRRFDRLPGGQKLHLQSLAALMHFDFNAPGAHSYEEAFLAMHRIGIPKPEIEQLFRRMVFNVVARNQDDHVKNIAFLMDQSGQWSLSPAFDVTYSFNPQGDWTSRHQMSIHGKREGFEFSDFRECGKAAFLKQGKAKVILNEVTQAVKHWEDFASQAGVAPNLLQAIAKNHRLNLLP